MNITNEEYIFLVKSLLGQKINKKVLAKPDEDELIKACIARANRDMITGDVII